jgi:hypothetical protein
VIVAIYYYVIYYAIDVDIGGEAAMISPSQTNNGAHDMYAHYFKAGKKHQIVLSQGVRPVGTTTTHDSKKAAIAYAKSLKAEAWNY